VECGGNKILIGKSASAESRKLFNTKGNSENGFKKTNV
jgi:hypothetical protein